MTTAAIPAAIEPAVRPSRFRWVMIAFAFGATVINYLDRQTLSVTAPILTKEFHMNDETYGLVLLAFMLAYTIMNGLSGPLIDRVGTKIGYACSMAWWSTAGILHVFARGPVSLGAFRFLLGVGEAGNWPAAVKLVSEWFPAKERALASGIFNSGAAIGAVAAPPVITWIVVKWGWQEAFVAVGAIGYVWLIGWWLVCRVPALRQNAVREKRVPVARLVQTRFVPFFTLSKAFIDPVWYFYIFWIPKYLSSVHHLSLIDIGKLAWIPFLTADLGNLAGGGLSALLIHRGASVPTARKIGMSVFALLMTSAIGTVFAPEVGRALAEMSTATFGNAGYTADMLAVGWALACVSTATFGYAGYSANMLALPADVFPKGAVASVYGFASMGSGFGGMVFSWLTGRMIDRHGYEPVLIGYGILPLIALAVLLLWCGPLQRDESFDNIILKAT